MKKTFLTFFLLIFFQCYLQLNAQDERKLIQFSGVVVTSDSLTPVSFAHIIKKNTNRGTISDYYGYFSFVAVGLDTIIFSSVGFKKDTFIIPDNLTSDKYSLIQIMSEDTVYLSETVIFPWANYEQFKEAFLKLNIPDDDIERAKKNIELMKLKDEFENLPLDAHANHKYYMQQKAYDLSYTGMYKPSLTSAINNPLLNPLAWAEFFKAWERGDFKRKNKINENN